MHRNEWVENADRWVAGFLEMFEEGCHKMVSQSIHISRYTLFVLNSTFNIKLGYVCELMLLYRFTTKKEKEKEKEQMILIYFSTSILAFLPPQFGCLSRYILSNKFNFQY